MRKRYEDRIGEKFCRLTIIEYLQDKKQYRYLCDCGRVGITNCRNILNGSTKSCGCLNDETRRAKAVDITGRVFGKLTAIAPADKKTHYGTRYWLCECECGQKKEIQKRSLIRGYTKSCNECNNVGMQGKTFGKYTIIGKKAVKRKNRTAWLCRCECGTENYVALADLKNGNSKSCGCIHTLKKTLVEGTALDSISLDRKVPSSNTSGHIGVYEVRNRGKWLARIVLKKKVYNLGIFDKKEDAILARKKAEDELFKPILEKYEYK